MAFVLGNILTLLYHRYAAQENRPRNLKRHRLEGVNFTCHTYDHIFVQKYQNVPRPI